MGLLYYYGEGVYEDMSLAADYFRRAATAGHTESASNLGLMLYSGVGACSSRAAPRSARSRV